MVRLRSPSGWSPFQGLASAILIFSVFSPLDAAPASNFSLLSSRSAYVETAPSLSLSDVKARPLTKRDIQPVDIEYIAWKTDFEKAPEGGTHYSVYGFRDPDCNEDMQDGFLVIHETPHGAGGFGKVMDVQTGWLSPSQPRDELTQKNFDGTELEGAHSIVKQSQREEDMKFTARGGRIQYTLGVAWTTPGKEPPVPETDMILEIEDMESTMVMMQKLDKSVIELLEDHLEYSKLKEKPWWFRKFNRLDLAKQLAEGMIYVHSQNFIHMDLKPENILLQTFKDKVAWLYKIIDWDYAVDVSGAIKPARKEWVSTPGYAAPEVIKNDVKKFPFKVDVYQVGVILLQLAATGPVLAQWKKMIQFGSSPDPTIQKRAGSDQHTYRTPGQVLDFMESEMGFTAKTGPHKPLFRVISRTLCGPSERFTMDDVLDALKSDFGDELPWIVDFKVPKSEAAC